ncbi:formate dehydrogenase accessory sulfurtransferase FdhD [Comamonas nitrativorans]|uniref:Sulfur carrier protein FdhD n=1 Tax=Comamonas nitrativorans TaxID=108437 RepID=A0ABV9GW30_9BURK
MSDDAPALPPSTMHTAVTQYGLQAPHIESSMLQMLAGEVPVALVFNGISHAVMMVTPDDLPALALGFALTEGIIDQPADCYDIQVQPLPGGSTGLPDGIDAVQVTLDIATRCMTRLQTKRRSLSGRTGCGICGVESFVGLDLDCPPLPAPPWLAQVDATTVLHGMQALHANQPLHRQTHSTHAAAWANLAGELLCVMEDVGRHNALDKLIGQLAQADLLGTPGFVLLSSRGSHELVRKCARVGIAALATLSAPTAMGVRMAQLAQLRLWGQCRAPLATLYAPGGIPPA